ncbi:uncharacterized protein LOC111405580 [Olea europaea var. sylvestris]|uniref:uncharacterized protein LOC111405580 n=1 Tax=Olea europaea var. sylvestris TaxID=158386 RepID=UPI000C1D5BAD|nr:uncharacterized protein LOC111405580 [Olea europaea var. sylvestris]
MLERFSMDRAKVVSSLPATHFRMSIEQFFPKNKGKEDMERVLYASAVASLMHAMVCQRTDIALAVGKQSLLQQHRRLEFSSTKKFIRELGFNQQSYVLFCDSLSAIHLDKNSSFMQDQSTLINDSILARAKGSPTLVDSTSIDSVNALRISPSAPRLIQVIPPLLIDVTKRSMMKILALFIHDTLSSWPQANQCHYQ